MSSRRRHARPIAGGRGTSRGFRVMRSAMVFPRPPVVERDLYAADGSVDHRPLLPRPGATTFSDGSQADPTPGVSDLYAGSPFEDRAAALLCMWLRGRADVLRERQWLRGSPAGEVMVMPMCFRSPPADRGT
jgi:hypothetical protein